MPSFTWMIGLMLSTGAEEGGDPADAALLIEVFQSV